MIRIHIVLAGLLLLGTAFTAQAQNYSPYGYNGSYYGNPYRYGKGSYYGNPSTYNNAPSYGANSNRRYSNNNTYGSNSAYRNPNANTYRQPYSYNSGYPYRPAYPYASGYGNRPYGYRPPYPYYKKKKGRFGNNVPFTGDSDFMEELWPGRDSMWDDALPADGPWNRSWGRAPWNRDYADMWGDKGGPEAWFDPSDPKEGVAQAWEDMLNTPYGVGTMPGGWKAPTISVPNPVDVGEEFKNVAKDMPDEVQNFSDGFTYGEDDGSGGYNNNGGSNDDKGITFDTSRHNR